MLVATELLLSLTPDEARALAPGGLPPKFAQCYGCCEPAVVIQCGRTTAPWPVPQFTVPVNRAFHLWACELSGGNVIVPVCALHDGLATGAGEA